MMSCEIWASYDLMPLAYQLKYSNQFLNQQHEKENLLRKPCSACNCRGNHLCSGPYRRSRSDRIGQPKCGFGHHGYLCFSKPVRQCQKGVCDECSGTDVAGRKCCRYIPVQCIV